MLIYIVRRHGIRNRHPYLKSSQNLTQNERNRACDCGTYCVQNQLLRASTRWRLIVQSGQPSLGTSINRVWAHHTDGGAGDKQMIQPEAPSRPVTLCMLHATRELASHYTNVMNSRELITEAYNVQTTLIYLRAVWIMLLAMHLWRFRNESCKNATISFAKSVC